MSARSLMFVIGLGMVASCHECAIVYRCFCSGGTFSAYAPYTVQMVRGKAAVFDSSGMRVRTDERHERQLTIEAMFAALREQIIHGADFAQIIYDPEFGFPAFAETGRIMVTDTGFGVTIRGCCAR